MIARVKSDASVDFQHRRSSYGVQALVVGRRKVYRRSSYGVGPDTKSVVVAELYALLQAVKLLEKLQREFQVDYAEVITDNAAVRNLVLGREAYIPRKNGEKLQLNGEHLKKMAEQIRERAGQLGGVVKFLWTHRKNNREADRLARLVWKKYFKDKRKWEGRNV